MNPAKDDNLGLSVGRLLAQAQRIADKVGYILDLAQLVIMGQNYSLPLLFKAQYLAHQFSIITWHQLKASSEKY
jgi:hypothetical protein